MKTKIFILSLFFSFSFLSTAISQLVTAASGDATALANTLVGAGISVSNATIVCPTGASGTFSGGNTTNIGLDAGVLMSSGLISNAIGPNNVQDATTSFGAAGDADLDALSGFTTRDACKLEFDFEAVANQVSISYVFGSEEYLEYVNTAFNDVFGFLVSGPNPAGGNYVNQNIAVIPVNVPVTINSINPGANAAFYINNPPAGGTTIQYDGFTVVLTATLNIVPCATYHFKLAIADATDFILDSGVFLEEASFESSIACNDVTITLDSDGTGSITAEELLATDLSNCSFSFSLSQSEFVCSDEGENTVTVTADDGAGTVLTCEATVTVVVPEGIISVDVGATCRTVYDGYGPAECTDITAEASGGYGPYTYDWSNGETSASITVCPTETTTYTVTATDTNGCTGTASVEVIVVNVSCGNNGDKVEICHIPPGNPGGSNTLCVDAASVPAHLAHGDHLGACEFGADPCDDGGNGGLQVIRPYFDPAQDITEPTIYPNPGKDIIKILVPDYLVGQVTVQLKSLSGEVILESFIQEGQRSGEINTISGLASGMYYLRIADADGLVWSQKWIKL